MSKEGLQVAVSSVSCAEYRVSHINEVVIPRDTTTAIMQRVIGFRDTVGPIFGPENVSVSLHPATVIDVPKAIELLKKTDVAVSSIDVPDIFKNTLFLQHIVKDVFTGNIGEGKLDVGWRVQNVGSTGELYKKLDQALVGLGNNHPKIVRIDAGSWLESTKGEEIRKKLRGTDGVILAVEIDSRLQTPAQYIEFLKQLSQTNDKEVPVFGDIDLGHLAESKFRHGNNSEIPEALTVFETMLRNKDTSMLVAATSLNQYKSGDAHTHVHFLNGPIDLVSAVGALTKAEKNEMLPFPPMVIAEFFPMEYDEVIGERGAAFWKLIKNAYEEV